MEIQALIAELPIEALDEAILDRLAWTDEDELNPVLVGPLVQSPACELGPVVDNDPLWKRAIQTDLI